MPVLNSTNMNNAENAPNGMRFRAIKVPRGQSRMLKTCIASLLSVVMLGGCSKLIPKFDEVLPDKRTQYKKSKTLPDLEIPPDLSVDAIQDIMAIPTIGEGDSASFSTYQERIAERKRNVELERTESGAIKLLENEHILAVEGVTAQIWPRLGQFWSDLGYGMELNDEELGVVETAWNENQEELIRDKFKVFAEPGQETGTTLLYVSHRGEELVPQGEQLVWQARARDITLERQVVEKIEKTLRGVSSETVEQSSLATAGPIESESQQGSGERSTLAVIGRAELISAGGGKTYLAVAEDFDNAWKSLAVALGQVGIPIEQEDQGRGLYFIRMPGSSEVKKKGMLSKLKFWDGDNSQLQISLTGVGAKTEIVVLNKAGKWATSDSANKLLSRLNQELNARL